MFAVVATALIGTAALATEGSLLYLTRRNAQNAADAAAIAAASAFQYRGRTASFAAANEAALSNGFPAAQVTINNPPTSGAAAGDTFAFEVMIARPVPLTLSPLLIGRASMVVNTRAVVRLFGRSQACILALTGSVTIQNSSSFRAPGCAVASNAPGTTIIIPQSNSTVTAQLATTVGTCNGCNNPRYSFTNGYREHAPPVSNPYAHLDAKAQPGLSGASCLAFPQPEARGPVAPTGTARAYCNGTFHVRNASSVTFTPGTYIFQNASLNIGSISEFRCAGCTFVFTGTTPGKLSITSTSSVTMSAPASNSDDPDYDGILFYRVASGAAGTSANPTLNLQSVSSFNLAGGIYFPQGYVKINSVSSTSNTNCLALVGGTIEISSLSSYRFDVSNCANYRTPVPTSQVARLVE